MKMLKFLSCFADYSGYAEASRNTLLALDKAGIELTTSIVHYQSIAAELGEGGRLALTKENLPLNYDTLLIETTPDNFHTMMEPLKYHIGRFYWETDKLNKVFAWNCNLMNELWIPTPSQAKVFKKNGVSVPMYAVPDCMNTKFKPYKSYKLKGHKGFMFYSLFQWTPRKNPETLLKTYWKTFEGKDDVSLLLKVYRVDFSQQEKQIIQDEVARWKKELGLKSYPRVYLYLDPMSREEVMRIHATGDCFVSAHRGEGWGYPQMEAMASGKPIISTNYLGIHEWIDDSVGWMLPYKMTPVFGMDWIVWYDSSQNWATVDELALSGAMWEAYRNQKLTAKKGTAAKETADKKFSIEAVSELLKRRLTAL